jgi:hypothetical protein
MFFNHDIVNMIIIANTLHGIFNYTFYNIVIIPTVEVSVVESLIHTLLLVTQFYLFIKV